MTGTVFYRKGMGHGRLAGSIISDDPVEAFNKAVALYWDSVEREPGETTDFFIEFWKAPFVYIRCGFARVMRIDIERRPGG